MKRTVLTLDGDGRVVRVNLSGISNVTDDTLAQVAAFPMLEAAIHFRT